MIIALDLGTRVGAAIHRDSTGLVAACTKDLTEEGMGWGQRLYMLWELLSAAHMLYGEPYPDEPSSLVYEDVKFHVSTYSAQLYGGYMGVALLWGRLNGYQYYGVPVATVKKHATGNGRAPKPMMVEAAKARWDLPDLTLDDNNEADALCLLSYVLDHKDVGNEEAETDCAPETATEES